MNFRVMFSISMKHDIGVVIEIAFSYIISSDSRTDRTSGLEHKETCPSSKLS
jgi:hypothetical protein